jgi:hypothetical protein
MIFAPPCRAPQKGTGLFDAGVHESNVLVQEVDGQIAEHAKEPRPSFEEKYPQIASLGGRFAGVRRAAGSAEYGRGHDPSSQNQGLDCSNWINSRCRQPI